MVNEPASYQQRNRQQDRPNCQPILPRPPQREQETDAQDQASNLASHNVKSTEDEQRADQRRPQITRRQCNDINPSSHVCYSALSRIEGDGFYPSPGAASGDGVAEFVEGDDQHLFQPVSQKVQLLYHSRLALTLNGHSDHRT